MNTEKKSRKYDGFLVNVLMSSVALLITSFTPFLIRLILSFFIKSPGLVELQADGSILFDVIYPVLGFFTTGIFLFFSWYTGYFLGKKIGYETQVMPDRSKLKFYVVISGIIIFIINMYICLPNNFGGIFGMQFWYFPAVFASLIGVFDKTNLLGVVSARDLILNNFIIESLTSEFIGYVFVFALILGALMVFLHYKGIMKGTEKGIKEREEFSEMIRKG